MIRLGDPAQILCDHCQYALISLRICPEHILWIVPHCNIECPSCGYFTELRDNTKLFKPKEN